jgi:hypothetical protein
MAEVAKKHPDLEAVEGFWALPRTLMGGTAAMRAAGKTYLPREAGESEEAYAARVNRTVLFNAFGKTVGDMSGRVFAKEIAFGTDVPANIKTWCENVDLTGRHLNVFAGAVFADAMVTGASHILVDTPSDPGSNRATQARPYLVSIPQENVIGWTYAQTADGLKLTSFRFLEIHEEQTTFEVKRTEQIKVLLPSAYQIWRKDTAKPGEWFMFEKGARGIADIPVATVYLKRHAFMVGAPPLQDLADLNVAHWQSSSDQRNILHVARVPILFGSGFPEDGKLVIGSASLTRATDPNAKLSYVEHSGNAIGSGREDLKDLEFQMQAMGLQLLVSQPGKTATGEVRDDVKENSRLAQWANALKDGLENALGFMAQLGGIGTDGGSLVVNTDFGITSRGAADIQGIIAAHAGGLISRETALREFIRRGFISDDMDVEQELERVAGEAMSALEDTATPGAGRSQGGTPTI